MACAASHTACDVPRGATSGVAAQAAPAASTNTVLRPAAQLRATLWRSRSALRAARSARVARAMGVVVPARRDRPSGGGGL